jgi:hypothetical protein
MAKNGADILKEVQDEVQEEFEKNAKKKLVVEALEKMFKKQVVSFDWSGDSFVASEAEVLQEGTIVIRFPVWYQEPRSKTVKATDPYEHTATVSPRLSEMRKIEFSKTQVKCGDFTVKP